MFSNNQSHELRSETRCAACKQNLVRITPLPNESLYQEDLYILQCVECNAYPYGRALVDLRSALALLNDEPMDLKLSPSAVIPSLDRLSAERVEAGLPSRSTPPLRSNSQQAGPSSSLSKSGLSHYRPDSISSSSASLDGMYLLP